MLPGSLALTLTLNLSPKPSPYILILTLTHLLHFWCCQGSGIEAFARLGDAVFWRRDGGAGGAGADGGADGAGADRPQLVVLQLVPSELRWRALGLRVEIRGEYPGAVGGAAELRTSLEISAISASASAAAGVDVWVRLPAWASGLSAVARGALAPANARRAAGGAATLDAVAGTLIALRYDGSAGAGSLELRYAPRLAWERIKDDRPNFASLHAPMYGPLVLAGLTYGERALGVDSSLLAVPPSASSELAALRVRLPASAAAEADAAAERACLVARWKSVWVVRTDRTRAYIAKPSAECLARATPIEDGLSDFAQAHGGGQGYALTAAEAAEACRTHAGCLLPQGVSAFASGRLYVMHGGASEPVALAAPPPTIEGARKGGTDAANAASWRLTDAPVGMVGGAAGSEGSVYIESFDTPGHVLTAGDGGGLALARADASNPRQRWLRRPAEGAKGVRLESAGRRGHYLSANRAPDSAAPALSPHRGAAISRGWRLGLAEGLSAAAAVELDPPFAEYAPASFWLVGGYAPPSAAAAERARHRGAFLLFPLMEMVDEHYTVYFCKPSAADARPPRFCL